MARTLNWRRRVGNVAKSVKSEADGQITVAGADLAAHFARSGRINEYRLYIHPVVLGGGKPYFQSGLSLTLKPLGKESLTQGRDVAALRTRRVAPALPAQSVEPGIGGKRRPGKLDPLLRELTDRLYA